MTGVSAQLDDASTPGLPERSATGICPYVADGAAMTGDLGDLASAFYLRPQLRPRLALLQILNAAVNVNAGSIMKLSEVRSATSTVR